MFLAAAAHTADNSTREDSMFDRFTPAILLVGIFVLIAPADLRAEQPDLAIDILATFDYPGSGNSTVPEAINERGDVTGFYNDPSGATISFVRFRDGRFSPPLIEPNDDSSFTQARSLNRDRVVCGYYLNAGFFHGFFFTANAYTEYDVPGATNTVITGINDAGDFAGEFTTPTSSFVAYSNIGGTVAAISIPGAMTSTCFAINSADEIVGDYTDASSLIHGFYQDPSGGLVFPIDPPGATSTFPFGISNRSVIVGRFVDSSGLGHGFLLRLPGEYVQFDYPGAVFTSLNGINSHGLLCGRYDDGSGIFHGFIGRLR
jgi:hypothetical protein